MDEGEDREPRGDDADEGGAGGAPLPAAEDANGGNEGAQGGRGGQEEEGARGGGGPGGASPPSLPNEAVKKRRVYMTAARIAEAAAAAAEARRGAQLGCINCHFSRLGCYQCRGRVLPPLPPSTANFYTTIVAGSSRCQVLRSRKHTFCPHQQCASTFQTQKPPKPKSHWTG